MTCFSFGAEDFVSDLLRMMCKRKIKDLVVGQQGGNSQKFLGRYIRKSIVRTSEAVYGVVRTYLHIHPPLAVSADGMVVGGLARCK